MKHPTKRLIIWRSLVQAQAGPRKVKALIAQNQAVSAFLFCSLFDFAYLCQFQINRITLYFRHLFTACLSLNRIVIC